MSDPGIERGPDDLPGIFTRVDPVGGGGERELLVSFLDYQRGTIASKVQGLDQSQTGRALAPSTLTLGGLVKHLTLVEESWFSERFEGRPISAPWDTVDWDDDRDWDFRTGASEEPSDLLTRYAAACQRSNAIIADAELDALAQWTGADGLNPNLRWILLHMIEETARHAGHADLIREAIDGTVGD